jgi:23S rRNA pseudouridine2605 synthase
MRINKYLANSGIGSRRNNEQDIRDGYVTVNGHLALLGEFVDSDKDDIRVSGKKVELQSHYVYYALNKPLGIISSVRDEHGRKTVIDIVKSKVRIFPVGRLDYNSSGLIILTNDGDLMLKLTHPRYHLPKKYLVEIKEPLIEAHIKLLQNGIVIDRQKTLPAEVVRFGKNKFEITLYQGIKRQIREMCAVLGLNVVSIHRTDIGPLNIGDLKMGAFRNLTNKEVKALKK